MARIEHVVVLALERRSFDHVLGFLDHPDPAFDGLIKAGPFTNPAWRGQGAASPGQPRRQAGAAGRPRTG
jgi:phospholipase C